MEKKNETKEIVKLKNDFLVYLEEKLERSPKTLENYDRYLNQFLIFTNVKTAKDIDTEIVDLFKKWLKNRRIYRTHADENGETMNEKTQNYYLIALRAFLSYLREMQKTTLDPKDISLFQIRKSESECLEDETVTQIIESFTKNDIKSLRDKAIFLLLLDAGVRVSELCALNKKDISDGHLNVKNKNNTNRNIPLSHETGVSIQQYLTLRRDTDEALFVNNGKRKSIDNSIRLTPRSVQRIIRQSAVQAGVTKCVTPQTLRHSFAVRELQKGRKQEDIRGMLGYKNYS